MKMLFFSSDKTEVEQVSREINSAGIDCEVRNTACEIGSLPGETELWVRDDRDCHRAVLLCVQRNMGFAKRTAPVPDSDTDCVLEEL